MKYLLPCGHCGEKTAIDTSQAGRQIVCQCGATLEVPSFRAVRALEPFDEPQTTRRRAWNPFRGTLFALGLILVVLGLLAAAAGGIGWSQVDVVEPPPEKDLERVMATIDGLGPSASWEVWVDMRDEGLGPYLVPVHVQARQWAQHYRWIMNVGLVVAAAGAAVSATPLLIGRRRRP